MRYSTRNIVAIGFIAALATVLMWIQTPLLPAAPFLEYDLSDVPVMIGSYALGPVAGVLIATVKAFVFLITKGKSGLIGALMNLTATVSFVFVASLIYHRLKKSFAGAILGLITGIITMTVVMTIMNIYVALPIWGIPAEQIKPLVISAIIPYNLLRGTISSIAVALVYRRFIKILNQYVNK